MPFDGKVRLTRLEKLERLKMLADKATGDQSAFCSCLLHDTLADPLLCDVPNWGQPGTTKAVKRWLATTNDFEVFGIFGGEAIEYKRAYLASLIAQERVTQ